MILNDLVDKLIAEHIGGHAFFDNLDAAVRNVHYFKELWKLHTMGDYYGYHPGIVLTGTFGKLFANWLAAQGIHRQIFVVDGGVRHQEAIDDLLPFLESVRGDYVLFDDSMYSGKTRDLIKQHIEQLGGKLTTTYVVYDGSKDKDKAVHSLYRYYEKPELDPAAEFDRLVAEGTG